MKQALINRLNIFKLRIGFFGKCKLIIWSIINPVLKKFNLKLPAIKIYLPLNKQFIFITDGTDLGTFFEIFLFNEYKLSADQPISRILDLGANSGYASIYFAEFFKNAQIIAVEADMDNVKKMQKNISAYNNRIMIEPSAVSSKRGMMDFYRNFKTSISGSTILRDSDAEKISVPSLTLADLEQKYGAFDIIKFDIEGGEWEAIRPEILNNQPSLWIGEYHEDLTNKPESEFVGRFDNYSVSSRKIANKRSVLTFRLKK